MFPPHLVKEPILFTIAKRFDVMPNIRRARVTDAVGEMILELEGQESLLQQSIETLRSQGIEVEYIEGEIFEA
ncbi:MAG: ferredoxin [Nitrospirae bacterium]|nr:MAG: ferredoxin [Nitrospirota bacterium]